MTKPKPKPAVKEVSYKVKIPQYTRTKLLAEEYVCIKKALEYFAEPMFTTAIEKLLDMMKNDGFIVMYHKKVRIRTPKPNNQPNNQPTQPTLPLNQKES